MAQIAKVRWTPLALSDFHNAYEYIMQERPSAARGIVQHVERALNALIRYPSIGRAGRLRGTRELYIVNTPFVMAYRVYKNQLEVLAFMHAARRWPESFAAGGGRRGV